MASKADTNGLRYFMSNGWVLMYLYTKTIDNRFIVINAVAVATEAPTIPYIGISKMLNPMLTEAATKLIKEFIFVRPIAISV